MTPPAKCEQCESRDDVQPTVTQVGGREPEARLLCVRHRQVYEHFANTLAAFVPITFVQ